MEKTSKELLQLERKDPSFAKEAALLICKNRTQDEKPKLEGKPFTAQLSKSQVLGKVKDFLGVISEANKNLQLNAKAKPEEFDIEVLNGNESEYIEMDLMLGVADLHTPEAMAAAEAAVAGKEPVFSLPADGSASESESSSDDDNDDDDEDEDEDEDDNYNNEDEHRKASPIKNHNAEIQEDGSLKGVSEHCRTSKRPKIVELS